MTTFWIICALLLAVALLFIVLPLLRGKVKNNLVQRDAANLEIFRDQIAEMDTDLRNGLLTPELYEQGKRELQARLLDEVKNPAGVTGRQAERSPHLVAALALIVLFPLAAVGLYWELGNFDAFQPQASLSNMNDMGGQHSAAVVKELEDKLAKDPQDAQGWTLLARSYTQMRRFADAARAFEHLSKLIPHDAQLWADYADIQAMANNESLAGLPTTLLNKALEIDPNNIKALALAGTAAMDRGDFSSALGYWEKAHGLVPKDSEGAQMLESGIRQARELLAQNKGGKPSEQAQPPSAADKQPAAQGREQVTGVVTLSDAMRGKASPGDTLFVMARPADGSNKLPLAIVRKQVKDLPLEFVLDDSFAMTPQMKLSNYDKVVVVARISKSGDAIPHPGDLQGASGIVKPGTRGVTFSIDNIVQ